jgi:hypothetical protein
MVAVGMPLRAAMEPRDATRNAHRDESHLLAFQPVIQYPLPVRDICLPVTVRPTLNNPVDSKCQTQEEKMPAP